MKVSNNEHTKSVKYHLKIIRLMAGYDSPKELVKAMNKDLEKRGVDYQVNPREYYFAEKIDREKPYKIDVQLAFTISKFLKIPIETLVQYEQGTKNFLPQQLQKMQN